MKTGECYKCGNKTDKYHSSRKQWWCGCHAKSPIPDKIMKRLVSGRWVAINKVVKGDVLIIGIQRKTKRGGEIYLPAPVVVGRVMSKEKENALTLLQKLVRWLANLASLPVKQIQQLGQPTTEE